MTTKALTRETDTHEHTAASRSGHTTIWLESLSKFGPFTKPYMARAEECLQRPHWAYLTVCVCVWCDLVVCGCTEFLQMQMDFLTDWVHQILLRGRQQSKILLTYSSLVKCHPCGFVSWTSPSCTNDVATLPQHMAACGPHPSPQFGNVNKRQICG